MEISALDIRCCRYDGAEITGAAMRDGQAIMGLEFLVYNYALPVANLLQCLASLEDLHWDLVIWLLRLYGRS